MTDDPRPSPEALLREAEREGRGKLKIFLGAAPGVGKTYEMLLEGAEKRAAGKDVVIGIVETHGRKETEALVAPLPVVPRKERVYRGQTLTEMDIDAVLERRPDIVLVDELAHTNAPGSRHPKRWQDIEELLAAGIDVMTTVNIQHVESLNDVVGSFTHVRVRETVPDKVFENAEIELIDLPPEDLIGRLEAGKVYGLTRPVRRSTTSSPRATFLRFANSRCAMRRNTSMPVSRNTRASPERTATAAGSGFWWRSPRLSAASRSSGRRNGSRMP